MAKLKAPLLSLGASGAIGKSLVFFGWKGLDVVREYVIPANPKSDPQKEQRGWLKEAVEKIHYAQKDTTYKFGSLERSAFALLGSLQATPRTWFNTIVKMWIDQRVAEDSVCIFSGAAITEADKAITFEAHITSSVGPEPTTGAIHFGTSKSALLSSVVCTVADLASGKALNTLTNGTKYYFQYRPTTASYVGSNSGIYHGTPHA